VAVIADVTVAVGFSVSDLPIGDDLLEFCVVRVELSVCRLECRCIDVAAFLLQKRSEMRASFWRDLESVTLLDARACLDQCS
jgi:hypothetical protein